MFIFVIVFIIFSNNFISVVQRATNEQTDILIPSDQSLFPYKVSPKTKYFASVPLLGDPKPKYLGRSGRLGLRPRRSVNFVSRNERTNAHFNPQWCIAVPMQGEP